MDPFTIGAFAIPLLGRLFGGGGGDSQQQPMQNEMQQLLQMQQRRMQQADPLYQAILKMAMGLAPTAAQQGFGQQPQARPMGGARSRMMRQERF